MNLLSIDTTAEICSIALFCNDQWFCFHESRPREHAKILLPEIQNLIIKAGIKVQDLDAIAFGRGPGSFTGIRIAAGVAHGLALAANCQLFPISTLQSLAFSAGFQGVSCIWTAIDARMSEVYFSRFEIDQQGIPQPIQNEVVIAPVDIQFPVEENTWFIGSGWSVDYRMPENISLALADIQINQLLPNAKDSAELAIKLLQAGLLESVKPEDALPVYLRDKVTWDNKPKVGS